MKGQKREIKKLRKEIKATGKLVTEYDNSRVPEHLHRDALRKLRSLEGALDLIQEVY